MAKYHLNTKTGDVRLCSAQRGQCPFGSADEHFSTAEEGRKFFEGQLGGQTFSSMDEGVEMRANSELAARFGKTVAEIQAAGRTVDELVLRDELVKYTGKPVAELPPVQQVIFLYGRGLYTRTEAIAKYIETTSTSRVTSDADSLPESWVKSVSYDDYYEGPNGLVAQKDEAGEWMILDSTNVTSSGEQTLKGRGATLAEAIASAGD